MSWVLQGEARIYGNAEGWEHAAQDKSWVPVQAYALPQRLMAVQAQIRGTAEPLLAIPFTGLAQRCAHFGLAML